MSRRRGFTRIELIVVVAIIVLMLLCMGGVLVPFQAAWYLISGWVTYPSRNAGNITIEWTSVAIAVVATVLFAAGLHRFLSKWSASRGSEGQTHPWPFRKSAQLTALVLFAFVAGTSMIGIVHQIAWMATTEEPLVKVQSGREASNRSISTNNLKQIGLALHRYHDEFHSFPAGGTYSENGKALHSWQTFLLPFADQADLFEKIDLAKPWNDPSTSQRKAFSAQVRIYLNPGIEAADLVGGYAPSHYAGNIRVLRPGKAMKLRDILDGSSNTMLAGEVNANFKAWGDPTNLRDPALGLNRAPDGFGSPFTGGALVLKADGSVQFLNDDTDPGVLLDLAVPDQVKHKVPEPW